jgi:hypothetical protein
MQSKINECQSMGFSCHFLELHLHDMFVPSHNAITTELRQEKVINLFFIQTCYLLQIISSINLMVDELKNYK